MYWLLAREVNRMRGMISRHEKWKVMVDLFMYREPEEAEKAEEDAKKQEGEGLPDSFDNQGDLPAITDNTNNNQQLANYQQENQQQNTQSNFNQDWQNQQGSF